MSISKEKFKEMLREKGLKVTNQRILVLEVLADHRDKHLTAEDIYELVRLSGNWAGNNLPDSAAVTGNAIGGSYQS